MAIASRELQRTDAIVRQPGRAFGIRKGHSVTDLRVCVTQLGIQLGAELAEVLCTSLNDLTVCYSSLLAIECLTKFKEGQTSSFGMRSPKHAGQTGARNRYCYVLEGRFAVCFQLPTIRHIVPGCFPRLGSAKQKVAAWLSMKAEAERNLLPRPEAQ